MSAAFDAFKGHVIETAGKLQVDTQLYEIASLSHIIILKPGQYSLFMLQHFGEGVLDQLHSSILGSIIDPSGYAILSKDERDW